MTRLTILLDLGGIIMDKRQQTEQWQNLIGEYFAPLLGRTAQEWNTAHQLVTARLLDQGEALQQASSVQEKSDAAQSLPFANTT